MKPKALAYAEDGLGVHRVWVNSEELVLKVQELYKTQASLEGNTRYLSTQIERRRGDLLMRVTEAHPDLSVAAHERHMRIVYGTDDELRTMVDSLNAEMGARDAIAAEIRGIETNLKAHVARMNELGGYFEYLSAAKNAQLQLVTSVNDYPW